jgi:hypothetical protein
MTLDNTICLDVETAHGNGVLQRVYLTELGLLMGKVFFPNEGIFINYLLSDIDKNLNLKFNPSSLVKRRQEMSLA